MYEYDGIIKNRTFIYLHFQAGRLQTVYVYGFVLYLSANVDL